MSTGDPPAVFPASAPGLHASLEERLAVVEERTKPKSKSPLDRIKDWGGVLSLVITVAYGFPLGLWDRFIEPEKKRTAQEITELRDTVEQSTTLMADGARALSGITDPFLYDVVGRAMNTRLYILMSKHKTAFERHIDVFSSAESLVIGYNFLSTNQIKTALIFFQHAEKHAAGDIIAETEAMRMQAKALFIQGPLQDKLAARALFSKAVSRLEQQRSYHTLSSYVSLTSEWGLFELMDGDWACGQQQIALARKAYVDFASFINDQGNFGRLITQKTEALTPRPGQSTKGC